MGFGVRFSLFAEISNIAQGKNLAFMNQIISRFWPKAASRGKGREVPSTGGGMGFVTRSLMLVWVGRP